MNSTTMNPSISLRYDGMMLGLHQYTEVDPTWASYGASFYLKTQDAEAVSLRREEKRVEFENGLKRMGR